jgi:hypothetical protein
MADEPNDPAEAIGEQVAGTVAAVQDSAVAAVESAEQRAQHAAETAAHLAEAARESAIGQEMAQHRREMDEWRGALESRLVQTEQSVASLPQTLSETLASHAASLRESLMAELSQAASTPPPPSTDPATLASPTGAVGTDGPRESPVESPPAPRRKRHVL